MMRCSKTSLVEKTCYAENEEKNGDVLLDNNSFATSHSKTFS